MEIREVFYHLIVKVRFYHLQVKFVALQKQYINSMLTLMSDLNKTCGQLRVIQNECQV